MNNTYCVIAHYHGTHLTKSVYVTGCDSANAAASKAQRQYFTKHPLGSELKALEVLPKGAKRWDGVNAVLVVGIANQKAAA